jgi:putative RNA 2'-phosphotransferase
MLIIRTLAYALRHNPTQFNLALDAEGWASIDQLVDELRFVRYDWAFLDWTRIERTISGSDRFEVHDGKIRAVYGHTIELENPPAVVEPPEFLYHGTAEELLPQILATGLLRMQRRFAHLSSDLDWVVSFVASKPRWVVLRVLAGKSHRQGIRFRQANRHVWLVETISPEFLQVERAGEGAPAAQPHAASVIIS